MPGFYLPSEEEYDPSMDDFVLTSVSKERRYQHFDLPLPDAERTLTIDFSTETKPHRFLPLLGFTDQVRKYVRSVGGSREIKLKERPIRFASHADAAYLQSYAEHLNPYYERALRKDGTTASVLAYRRDGGTNIHHAKSLFDEIRSKGDCSVFALDISGFFDSLDHRLLRDEVARLLGVSRLEGHHATVWKNLTRYSWVETSDLDAILGKRRVRNGRVCSPRDFADFVRGRKQGLVQKHDQSFGIPQGTPISGLYANIYLQEFDQELKAWCAKYGGSYRRYSDDIAIVLPLGSRASHVVGIVEKILADYSLALSANKTDTADFKGGLLVSPRPIQYLGFTFDGTTIKIRPSSMDAYRAKMRRGIHAKMVAAKMQGVAPSKVFKREALSRYTHLGKRRNFLRYAYKAADVMGSQEIRDQVKPHMTWFRRAWDAEISNVFR